MLMLPILHCPACHRQFGLTVGTGTSSLDSLPDPFKAICVHCEEISSFKKTAVGTVAVGASTEPSSSGRLS
jgi:hypothetical protein